MTLYHGSNVPIDTIDLSHSKPFKDFGQGFYLSDNRSQAEALARQKVLQLQSGTPTVTAFSFDEALLTDGSLNVKVFRDYSEDWARFVIANRRDRDFRHDYDVIIGPIANDKVGVQIRLFMDHYIDTETLVNNLKYMKGLTVQYYFGTEKAIRTLTRQ